ncbi:ABC transporter permease [Flavobacterium terrigena]|uniref:Lipoprotein-releasing system permease protein n=1 Tax=Flavobacterium terrigena TaxID=402734 RepID=A0A1H6QI16_9FLAO|nr:FtsX-like permease family protein [Flavobacterium terrigena]SEI40594.1 lipoprotein-releasing system permease protein [Flavobacterium terrigena]
MNYKLIASISISLLMARWRQTLVAAIGVTFSITMFVGLLSFMSGLNDMLDGLILNRTAHIRLYKEIKPSKQQPIDISNEFKNYHNFIRSVKPKNERLELYDAAGIMNALKNDERVVGVVPKVTTQVFYNVGALDINGIIDGIDAAEESRLFQFKDYVVDGNYLDLKNTPNSIILGKGVAEKMMVQLGDVIVVTTSKGEQISLKVVGLFQSGIRDIDIVQSYCSLNTTQRLLGESSTYITDIQVKLKDVSLAPLIAKEYENVFHLDALDIQTANAQFETGSFIRTLISYSVGITLLIVAGFGIYNILNMMIYEKMDSIAILKATGFSGKDVNAIFILIASTIGIVGGIFGLAFGLGLSVIIDHVPFNTASLPAIKTYPINYNPKIYLIGLSFSIVTTYFAGYFPARRASKIDPVIIIRGK